MGSLKRLLNSIYQSLKPPLVTQSPAARLNAESSVSPVKVEENEGLTVL